MLLNRRQRRFFAKKSPEGKRLQKLSAMHPDKVASRRANMESGKQQQDEFTRAIQEKLVESLGEKEQGLIALLKDKKVKKAEIDEYMDIWSGVNFWPKPDDYHSLRKQLKKLNKKYGVNG